MKNNYYKKLRNVYPFIHCSAIVSLFLIIIYLLVFTFCKGDNSACVNIIIQILCSYIASIIIFILTSFIPEQKRIDEINGRINVYVKIIYDHMGRYMKALAEATIGYEKGIYEEEDFVTMANGFNASTKTNIVESVKEGIKHYNCIDYVLEESSYVKKEISELEKMYATYITTELQILLDKTKNCVLFHSICNIIKRSDGNLICDGQPEIFSEYYDILCEMRDYLEKESVSIHS